MKMGHNMLTGLIERTVKGIPKEMSSGVTKVYPRLII